VWDLARRPQPWTENLLPLQRSFGLDDVRAEQAAAGVGRTVLVQCVANVDETRELLVLAAQDPLVAGVVGWLDLDSAGFPDALGELRAGPGGDWLVGLRHQLQVEPDPEWLARGGVRRSLAVLGASGLAYDVVVSPEQLPLVLRTVAELPDLSVVLDHGGNPPVRTGSLAVWRRDVAALAALGNVAVKLSGLATHGVWGATTAADLAPVAEHLLARFGPERTMFGSDWPVCLLGSGYTEVVNLAEALVEPLTDADRALVWERSAANWYGLREHPDAC